MNFVIFQLKDVRLLKTRYHPEVVGVVHFDHL